MWTLELFSENLNLELQNYKTLKVKTRQLEDKFWVHDENRKKFYYVNDLRVPTAAIGRSHFSTRYKRKVERSQGYKGTFVFIVCMILKLSSVTLQRVLLAAHFG